MNLLPETDTDLSPETFCEMKDKRKQAILCRARVRPAEHPAPRCPAGFCLIGTPKVVRNERLIGFNR